MNNSGFTPRILEVENFVGNTGYSANAYAGLVQSDISASAFATFDLEGSANQVFDEDGLIGTQQIVESNVGNLVADTKYAVEASGSVNLDASEELIFGERLRKRAVFALDVADENFVVKECVDTLNFLGDDIQASPSLAFNDGADINSPAAAFVVALDADPNFIEIGNSVNQVLLTATYNNDNITSQVITGLGFPPQPALNDRVFPVTETIINNESWQLDAVDNVNNQASDTTEIAFGGVQFWGKATAVPTISSEVQALPNSNLVTGKTSPIDFAVSGTPEFMVFAYPEPYGDIGRVVDPQTGFDIPTVREADVLVARPNGYQINYRVYRAVNQTAGSFTWTFQSNSAIQLPDPVPQVIPVDSMLISDTDYLAISDTDYLSIQ